VTRTGFIEIRDIRVGDEAQSRDALTGAVGFKPALAQYSNPYAETVYIRVRDGKTGTVQEIVSNRIHPFFVSVPEGARVPPSSESHAYEGEIEGGAWVDADDLAPGFRLLEADGGWSEVVSVRIARERLQAYNLTIADWHTYFVKADIAASLDAVWVHNNCNTLGPDGKFKGAGHEAAFSKHEADAAALGLAPLSRADWADPAKFSAYANQRQAALPDGHPEKGPGSWQAVPSQTTASASQAPSADYEASVTNSPRGSAYVFNGKAYDGYKDGELIDAKGDFDGFVNADGSPKAWWNKPGPRDTPSKYDQEAALIKTGIDAANGAPVRFIVKTEKTAKMIERMARQALRITDPRLPLPAHIRIEVRKG
jgi:Pretoxin HINT domain